MTIRDPHMQSNVIYKDADPEWRRQAACRGASTGIFFPQPGEDVRPAIAVCAGCPVREPCLAFALQSSQPGVWGGKSEKERRRIQGRRKGIR